MDEYLDILRNWERDVMFPAVYGRLDELLPSFHFRRVHTGRKDHWASPLKIDGSRPKRPVREKTVVYPTDMKLREQGDYANGVSVVDMVCRQEGLASMYEFNCYVSDRLGLQMPRSGRGNDVSAVLRRRELLGVLNDYFVWCLGLKSSRGASAVRGYLSSRGFTPQGISHFGFGYVPSWDKVVRYVTVTKGYSKELLDEVCGVADETGRSSVGTVHQLSVPYICGGVLKGFMFRRIKDGSGPKYLASPGLDRSSIFFNIPVRTEKLVIMEGEMDAIMASAAGVEGAVAIGGSDISGDRKSLIIDAFSRGVKDIVFCPDLDAGRDEEESDFETRHLRIMKTIHSIKDVDILFDSIRLVLFEEPCDPDEYIRRWGSDAFRELVKTAVPYWVYIEKYNSRIIE